MMNLLTYPKKFALIAVLFLAVLASPMYELVKSVNDDIKFSSTELDGSAYLTPTMRLVQHLVENRRSHGSSLDAVKDDIAKVDAVNATLGDGLKVTENWTKLKANLGQLSANTNDDTYQALISETLALYGPVGFNSNLVLDPDADSYSLMDSVVLQLPPMMDLVEQSRILAGRVATNQVATHDELVQLVNLKTQMEGKFGMTKGDIDIVYPYSSNPEVKPALEKVFPVYTQSYESYMKTLGTIIQTADKVSVSPASINSQAVQLHQNVVKLHDTEMEWMNKLIDIRIAGKSPKLVRSVTIASIVLLVIAYLLTGFYLSVRQAINALDDTSKKLAAGDLTARLELSTKDELARLCVSFNTMAKDFGSLISNIKTNTETLAKTSNSVSSASQKLKSTAEEMGEVSTNATYVTEELDNSIKTVAAAVEESTANIKQVYAASEKVAETNATVSTAVEKISVNMQTLSTGVENVSTAVTTVAAAMEEMSSCLTEVSKNASQASNCANKAEQTAKTTSETVDELGHSAKEIGNVMDVIRQIASQTNLLALNATIEAASAGEAGKGFAVVANEVKELAKQSANAAEDIQAKIEEMQKNTHSAVNAINEISKVINELSQYNHSIAGAVEEQTVTVSEISRSIAEAAHSAKNMTESVQETATKTMDVVTQIQESAQGFGQITVNLEELSIGSNEISKNAMLVANSSSEMSQNIVKVNSSSGITSVEAIELEKTATDLSMLATDLERMVNSFKV